MKMQQVIIGTFFFAVTALLSACQKEKQTATMDATSISNESTSTFVDKTVSEDEDAMTLKSGSGTNSCSGQQLLPPCAIVSEDSETFPKNITIDFGSGCTDAQGRTRSGMILINLTDSMSVLGAVRTVTFENYYIDDIHITGTRVTTNTGDNELGHPTFSRSVNTVITRNGNAITRQCNENIEWLSGYNTPECGDNVFQIIGSGSVIRPNGTQVFRTIVEPLILDRVCGYVTQGVVEIQAPNGTITMDFGNGACDDQASVTGPNGQTQSITLHH